MAPKIDYICNNCRHYGFVFAKHEPNGKRSQIVSFQSFSLRFGTFSVDIMVPVWVYFQRHLMNRLASREHQTRRTKTLIKTYADPYEFL